MKKLTFAVTILVAFCAVTQQAPPVLRGSWLETAVPRQVSRVGWSGQFWPATKTRLRVPGPFSTIAIRSSSKAPGPPGNRQAAGKALGQAEYRRAGLCPVHGRPTRAVSAAKLLKTCSNKLRKSRSPAPGKAAVHREIGGFSIEKIQ